MSKAVRWQVPFVSLQGIHYRVDIYDEGYTGTPVQLYAGPTPFVTDEDSSDDYFAAVRAQTGTLQVCTRKPDGGTITLADLMPETSVARPVRLWKILGGGATGLLEWQGFLSCEAYSQDYTSIPQVLSLPVISVLESMDSVEIPVSESMSYALLMSHIAYAINAINTETGMSLFSNLYFSDYIHHSLIHFRIYNNPFFSTDECVSGDNITHVTHSISCKEILENIAKFFGATWHEVGSKLYMTAIGKSNTYKYASLTNIYDYYVNNVGSSFTWSSINAETYQMAQLQWMGTSHNRNIRGGARYIKIDAGLKDFECNIELMECPTGSLVENPANRQQVYGEVHANRNDTFYNLAHHKHIASTIRVFPAGSGMNPHLIYQEMTQAINYDKTIFWAANRFRSYYDGYVVNHNIPVNKSVDIPFYCTSYMAFWRNSEDELQSGLMICGAPQKLYNDPDDNSYTTWTTFQLTSGNAVYMQSSALMFSAHDGYLRINFEVATWRDVTGAYSDLYNINDKGTLTIAVQFGSKWLQKSGSSYLWSDTFTTFGIDINYDGETISNWSESMNTEEGKGIFVSIPSQMSGYVKLYVYHEMDALIGPTHHHGPAFDVFIKNIEIEYSPLIRELKTDRSSNTYAAETGKQYRDEISTSLTIASYAKNEKTASMIYRSDNIPTNALVLGGNIIRPEKDLLNRMVEYYSSNRQTLELEVAHPTAAPLPLLRLNGINDGKVYLPLSESRDWQTDECKLTCFETPT